MKEIDAVEPKNTLAYLLDIVEKGEEIIITRNGKPMARLSALQKAFDPETARQAAEDIRKLSKDRKLGGIPIREMIEEGRI